MIIVQGDIMDKLNLVAEYKELYYKEIEYKDAMNNKIGTSLTLLTILCTGQTFIIGILTDLNLVFKIIPIIFFLFELVSAVLTLITLYYFLKTYYKNSYYLISIKEIKEKLSYNASLINFYVENEIEEANCIFLKNYFIDKAIQNREQNLIKNKYQMKLSAYMTLAVFSLIITYIFWILLIKNFTY
ncbi:hypothetical protein [Anaerotignum sp.]|uniref:hypothetical protein n=1 Tax=Anaerotignum sp. TaxID=2039241 RepID=UPI0027145D8F|nr:hypothetical protein [Anaerotignum sp.]